MGFFTPGSLPLLLLVMVPKTYKTSLGSAMCPPKPMAKKKGPHHHRGRDAQNIGDVGPRPALLCSRVPPHVEQKDKASP